MPLELRNVARTQRVGTVTSNEEKKRSRLESPGQFYFIKKLNLFHLKKKHRPKLEIGWLESLKSAVADLSPLHFRKLSATDGTKKDQNIGEFPGFGGFMKRAKSTTPGNWCSTFLKGRLLGELSLAWICLGRIISFNGIFRDPQ